MAAGAGSVRGDTTPVQRIPLKIGHRASNMKMIGDFKVFQVASQIPGITGVELQAGQSTPNLYDLDALRRYKKEANRWGFLIPSLAGVWEPGVTIRSPRARQNLEQSIRAAEMLGSSVVLVAAYSDSAPDMTDESSFGPLVALLQDVSRQAADSGVVLGIEMSMSPQDHRKFVDIAGSSAIKVYYDVHNVAYYGHAEDAIPGIRLIGKDRICQVHVKNEGYLIEEPGPIDWPGAFQAFNEIGYDGWYVFETQHKDRQQMLEATRRNVAFLQKHCEMPLADS
jgi:sugar phosphate isomerase/epimerase